MDKQGRRAVATGKLPRTFLNYSLGREIDAEARRVQERTPPDASQGSGPTAAGATSPKRKDSVLWRGD